MAITELTVDNFEKTIENNDMIIVDFWAPWCAPCRSFAPVFDEASEKHPDIVFAKVNTDEQHDLAGWFQIRSIPTLMIFREHVIVFSQPGALPASALDDVIEKAKALDMEEVHRQIAAKEAEQPQA